MPRSLASLRALFAGFAAGLALAALCAAPRASAEPLYTVELCCDLCPMTANRAAYNTKFLQSFTTLVQGRDGWLFRSDDDLRMTFGPNEEGYEGLRRLRDALKARGIDLVIVYQPTRAMMHADKLPPGERERYNLELARTSYTATMQRFRKAGIVVPDFTKLLYERSEEEYFFRGDHHWTPYGARRTAQVTAEAVKKLPSYQALPKKQFVTTRGGTFAKRGTLQKAVTQLCGFGFPDQFVDQFVTTAEGEDDLFGEAEVPKVTLVGTSNSDSAYNFAGFLQEFLGVDVLNVSIAGGGYDGGLLSYLPSDEFQKSPPKILIWEIETYHNLSNRSFYRQVVPLVGNGCRNRKPLLTGRTELRSTSTEVLFNGGGAVLPLASKHHIIDVTFDDPGVHELKATIWYTNGSKENLTVKHSEHVSPGGRFAVELRDDGDWGDRGFMSMDLHLPEGVRPGVTVDAQLCARPGAPAAAPKSRNVTMKESR